MDKERDLEKLHNANVSYGWRKKLKWEKVRISDNRLLVNSYEFNANATKCNRCGSMAGDTNLSYFIIMSTGVFYGCAKCGFLEGPMPINPPNKPGVYFDYIASFRISQEIDPYEAINVMRRNKQDTSFGNISLYYEKIGVHLPSWPLY